MTLDKPGRAKAGGKRAAATAPHEVEPVIVLALAIVAALAVSGAIEAVRELAEIAAPVAETASGIGRFPAAEPPEGRAPSVAPVEASAEVQLAPAVRVAQAVSAAEAVPGGRAGAVAVAGGDKT